MLISTMKLRTEMDLAVIFTMSDELDYVYPGTVFLCLGFLACLNSFYLQLTGKTIESGLCQSVTITVKGVLFPLESFSRTLLCIIGILMEILTTSKTNTFLRSQDSQEMLMYCFYMFASFCECACILSNKIDRKLTMVSYAVASFVESYFAFHFIESRENSCMTMCWSLLAFVQGSAFLLQSMSVNNSSVLIIRNATMILHGTWFYHIAFSQYIYSTPSEIDDLYVAQVNETKRELDLEPIAEETVDVQVSKVAFDFVLHFLLAFMITVWTFIIMSIVLRSDDSDLRDPSSRPLVDDDDMSDFEEPAVAKDELESRIVPDNGEDNGNSHDSVTNFGI
ncbi:uncharacterized protein LOC142335346 isoform X2 [Convolutriloba macropyga]|uniref:uncharacterized protein LOC142335346 isoform X2 n=1 Tax=Convolutriloba macropyga TaxID=536237 RepID=UPI003F525F43